MRGRIARGVLFMTSFSSRSARPHGSKRRLGRLANSVCGSSRVAAARRSNCLSARIVSTTAGVGSSITTEQLYCRAVAASKRQSVPTPTESTAHSGARSAAVSHTVQPPSPPGPSRMRGEEDGHPFCTARRSRCIAFSPIATHDEARSQCAVAAAKASAAASADIARTDSAKAARRRS